MGGREGGEERGRRVGRGGRGESECWRFYAISTARVIFTAKTCLDIFSLSREQVWTFSVLGDRIYEMKCLFVAVGLDACFIVLPQWDNMSQAHIILTLGRDRAVVIRWRQRMVTRSSSISVFSQLLFYV